ncbi:type IV pilin protein [Candidatus Avelusimicrobium sp.]|uniref:type IV pilin protein n=1 Tax=Candidatus Avelusimicrobium sp. TaxID=3048833 RepID=UPI003D7ED789
MKGFGNISRATTPSRRHSVRFLYGISSFRNNRFPTTTLGNDATSTSGRTVNTFHTITAGFTLIELLVVVLIIGILSAVALPQYTKAVEKSRTAEAITGLTAIGHAQEVYHLATGSYADDWSDLDVSIQEGKNFTFGGKTLSEGLYPGSVAEASRVPRYTRYTLLYMPEEQKIVCFAHATNQRQYCISAGLEIAANSY